MSHPPHSNPSLSRHSSGNASGINTASNYRPASSSSQHPPTTAHTNYLSADHAAAIQTTLQQIEQQMTQNTNKIDDSLRTPYSIDSARSDYHATLALLATLEAQTQPIASIGYDTATLTAFAAQPPITPQDSIARFSNELAQMNAKLKVDSTLLQALLAQQSTQTKLASREFKTTIESMRIGEVNKHPADVIQAGLPNPHAFSAALTSYQQQTNQQGLRR